MTASLVTLGLAIVGVPTAGADPADPVDPYSALPPAGDPTSPADSSDSSVTTPAAADACNQFSGAMNYAALGYEDFADATAGTGNFVNYADPNVQDTNAVGRTALREAAVVAFKASTTPGVPPEISGPMQKWSFDAGRLLLTMGVNGGGDALNAAATDLNVDGHNVQMACAAAGTRA